MFGRKKTIADDGILEPKSDSSAMSEASTRFGTHLAQALEADGPSNELASAIDRLRDSESGGTLEGLVAAVAAAVIEPDSVVEREVVASDASPTAAGPAPHTLVDRWDEFYGKTLDGLRETEQALIDKMAADEANWQAQRAHDNEELRQVQVAITAAVAARDVLQDQSKADAPTKPAPEVQPRSPKPRTSKPVVQDKAA